MKINTFRKFGKNRGKLYFLALRRCTINSTFKVNKIKKLPKVEQKYGGKLGYFLEYGINIFVNKSIFFHL